MSESIQADSNVGGIADENLKIYALIGLIVIVGAGRFFFLDILPTQFYLGIPLWVWVDLLIMGLVLAVVYFIGNLVLEKYGVQ